MIDAIIGRFQGVKSKGSGFLVRCPAHNDREASLSIDPGANGGVVMKCFRGCEVAAILDSAGLTMDDIMPPKTAVEDITVERLASAKGLPAEVLRKYGAKNVTDMSAGEKAKHGVNGTGGVWLPYRHLDGTIGARTRLRHAIVAKEGSKWLKGEGLGVILPYGLHDLKSARDEQRVVLCEGESDYWTLRHAGVPALGIPGADMCKTLFKEHLEGIQAVYICQDNDPAGASFVAKLREHMKTWGLSGIYPIQMPAGFKDVNDLYRKDPKGFSDRIAKLVVGASTVNQPKPREWTATGDIYRLTAPEYGLVLEVDQLGRKWGDLCGDLSVTHNGVDLSRASINLSSMEKRQAFAGQLQKTASLPEVDWKGLVEDFALRCLKAQRDGSPSVNLRDVPMPSPDETYTIDGVVLPKHHPACIFGDGGTGKSYLALHWAGILTSQGVPCLYVDAEADAGEHRLRIQKLFGQNFPAVHYLRLDRALVFAVDQIRRIIRDKKVAYVVFDSVGVLTNGPPEGAEAALGYIRSLRQIGVGSLSIAHVTKNGDTPPQKMKPFGSVMYHNGFRATYFAKADEDRAECAENRLGLWNPKVNNGAPLKPFGMEVVFDPNQTHVRPFALADIESLALGLPPKVRLRDAMLDSPGTVQDLSERSGLSQAAVRKALQRGEGTTFSRDTAQKNHVWSLKP